MADSLTVASKVMVSELVVNEEVVSYFFIPELPQVRKSKKDKDYLCLKLQDKSGIVDGRVWDYPPGFDPTTIKKGSFVKVRAQCGEWQEVKQLSISQIRLAEKSDGFELGDFFERSERPTEEMWSELQEILSENVKNSFISELLSVMFEEGKENFCRAPAAKSVHHCYISGLLEHSLSLCKTALLVSDRYNLNKDLMLAACVLHDWSKTEEMSWEAGINYTVSGSMLGHISLGLMAVSRAIDSIDGFPQDLKIAVLHLIASHHGSLAWGSPRIPLMREAIGFHICDLLDSRMGICDRAIKKGFDESGMTEWVRELEGQLWRGPWQDDDEAARTS